MSAPAATSAIAAPIAARPRRLATRTTKGSASPKVTLTAAAPTAAAPAARSAAAEGEHDGAEHQQRTEQIVVGAAHGVEQDDRVEAHEKSGLDRVSTPLASQAAVRNAIATAARPAIAFSDHRAAAGGEQPERRAGQREQRAVRARLTLPVDERDDRIVSDGARRRGVWVQPVADELAGIGDVAENVGGEQRRGRA